MNLFSLYLKDTMASKLITPRIAQHSGLASKSIEVEFSIIFMYFPSMISVSFSWLMPSSRAAKFPIIMRFKLGAVSFWKRIFLAFLNLN
jgi:hypothetical protein